MNDPIASVVIAPFDDAACKSAALILASQIREYLIPTLVDARSVKIKQKMKHSHNLESFYTVIIGPEEVSKNSCQIIDMDNGAQDTISLSDAARFIAYDYWTEYVAENKKLVGFNYES